MPTSTSISMDLIPVGFSNYVSASRLVAIANPASLPIKRLIRQAEDKGLLVDLTSGRKAKAVLVLDTKHLILVSRLPETIAGRASLPLAKSLSEPQEDDHD
jgi:extracellular matrix regulatory protein A